MLGRYNPSDVKRAFGEPSILMYEVFKIIDEKLHAPINNRLFDRRNPNPIDVMSEDWDNLIILDACRYDAMKDYVDIEGELKKVISKGGSSWEFMLENFVNRELHDTVYVTANLHVEKIRDDVFYTVETVPSSKRNPESVVEAAKRAFDKYPDKRLLVHFMQPHRPYLGPTADLLRKEVDKKYLSRTSSVQEGSKHIKPKIDFAAFKTGALPLNALHQMYNENLAIAVEQTKELLNYIEGKSIITADHGELLGEKKGLFRQQKFGHPQGYRTAEAYEVPWLIVEGDTRRKTIAEKPIGFKRLDEEVVRSRLQELGYLDADI